MGTIDSERPHSEEIREIWKLFRETDREIKESQREIAREFKEIAERFRKTDEKFNKTNQQFQETKELVDRLTSKWGRFVEGLVAPGAIRMFRERGINIKRVFQRVEAHKDCDQIEIDILGVNDTDVLAVEVKSTLGVEDVKDHIERLGKFKTFFPEYAHKDLIGAVAGIVMDGGSDKFAYRRGLYVIGQAGETVYLLNDDKFIPKKW